MNVDTNRAASGTGPTFALTTFKGKRDARPNAIAITWAEFCAKTKKPVVRADKDGELFAGAWFDPAHRCKENVKDVSVLALDYDDGATLDTTIEKWKRLGVAFAWYTTHSHQRVKNPGEKSEKPPCERYRIVIPLDSPIPAVYYPALWRWAGRQADGVVADKNTKDCSRMSYWPAKASADAEYAYGDHDGAMLNWREISEIKYVVKAFESECAKLKATKENGESRHDQLFRSAAALGELVGGGGLCDVHTEKALVEIGLDIGKPDDEVRRTVKDGLAKGARKPRTPDASTDRGGANGKKNGKSADQPSPAPGGDDQTSGGADASKTAATIEDEGLTLSQFLIQLARDNAELFHDAGGDAYLTATVGDHKENYRLGSRDSKDWLAGLLYRETERVASGDKINEALTVLRAIARHDSAEIETHVRIAGHDGAVYFDLCDKEWRQVKIDQASWKVIGSANSPVRFVRAKGMLPLPVPVSGGSLKELRGLLNLPDDDADNWPMILGWLVSGFRPCNDEGFDYPLLAIHGEQGSAKSSAQRILRDLIDPNKATLRAAPRNERDLAIAASHGRIISCDNLTYISENLSNAFCRLSTGGGFATRELFTDDGEVIFDAQRPVILNGIAEVVTKSDLLDRTLLTQLPVIEPKKRLRKRVLNKKFADARPRILGALLDVVSAGLKRLDEGVEMDEWPRMSDFAEWVIACELALGFETGAFIAAYRRNIGRANGLAIDSSIVARAIIELIEESEDHKFDGTVKGLLDALNAKREAPGKGQKNKDDWPTTPEQLRADLVKIAPNLRREKIGITFGRRSNKGRRVTIARLLGKQPSQPSLRHQTNGDNGLQSDGCGDGLDFGEFATVTPAQAQEDGASASDGLECDEKADRHPNRHSLNHSKQTASDGVTVVTVSSVPAEPAPADPVNGIPLLITSDMRRQLYARGIKGPEINSMTPAQAWAIINGDTPQQSTGGLQ